MWQWKSMWDMLLQDQFYCYLLLRLLNSKTKIQQNIQVMLQRANILDTLTAELTSWWQLHSRGQCELLSWAGSPDQTWEGGTGEIAQWLGVHTEDLSSVPNTFIQPITTIYTPTPVASGTCIDMLHYLEWPFLIQCSLTYCVHLLCCQQMQKLLT